VLTGRWAVWGAGVGVVLSAASGALINELQAGWLWWVASAIRFGSRPIGADACPDARGLNAGTRASVAEV
jgi:hypothetical protein